MVSERIIGQSVEFSKCHKQEQENHTLLRTVAASSSIFRPLKLSIFTFHRRLLRCVSRWFKAMTINHSAMKLEKLEDLHTEYSKKKRTIILDLDETLVHATIEPPNIKYDFIVKVRINGEITPVFVVKRPGVTEFLARLSENYKVVVFTAGLEEYASQVLDNLDKESVITQRLYRDSCKDVNGKYVKDLSLVVGKDLGSTLIVDDNPSSYSLQPENGVPIKAFVDDLKDQELLKLVEFLESCYGYEDMRDAVEDLWES